MSLFNVANSGFSCKPISAYFITDKKELVIIDCPVSTYEKLKQLKLRNYRQVYILITHNDLDYFREIDLLVKKLKKSPIIVFTNSATGERIQSFLEDKNIKDSKFKMVEPTYLLSKKLFWFKRAIRIGSMSCAYHLIVDNIDVFYSVEAEELNPLSEYIVDNSLLMLDSKIYSKISDVMSNKSSKEFPAEVAILASFLDKHDMLVNVTGVIDVMTLIQPEQYIT